MILEAHAFMKSRSCTWIIRTANKPRLAQKIAKAHVPATETGCVSHAVSGRCPRYAIRPLLYEQVDEGASPR